MFCKLGCSQLVDAGCSTLTVMISAEEHNCHRQVLMFGMSSCHALLHKRDNFCEWLAHRQAAAFQAWRGAVVDAAMREQGATSLAVQLQDCRMHSWLRAWQLHCLQKQTHARILQRLLSNKAQSRLNSTFQAWNSYVVNIR